MRTKRNLTIYGDSRSGNCYKLKHLCAEMDVGYDWQEIDIMAGESRTSAFLARNRNGKIPLLELPDGRYLAESNAILYYLADGSEFLAGDAFSRALIMQWLFFEQYSHEPYIATSRFIIRYLGGPAEKDEVMEEKKAGGYAALDVMEEQLAKGDYFSDDVFTIADIALFAYTHVADEGGFDLGSYTHIRQWIGRIQNRPRYVPMNAR